jgi:hypothetical protein
MYSLGKWERGGGGEEGKKRNIRRTLNSSAGIIFCSACISILCSSLHHLSPSASAFAHPALSDTHGSSMKNILSYTITLPLTFISSSGYSSSLLHTSCLCLILYTIPLFKQKLFCTHYLILLAAALTASRHFLFISASARAAHLCCCLYGIFSLQHAAEGENNHGAGIICGMTIALKMAALPVNSTSGRNAGDERGRRILHGH